MADRGWSDAAIADGFRTGNRCRSEGAQDRVPRNPSSDLAVVSIGEGGDIRFDERLIRCLFDTNHLLLVNIHELRAVDRAIALTLARLISVEHSGVTRPPVLSQDADVRVVSSAGAH